MEVMKHWGENPGCGHRYTLPALEDGTEGQCHAQQHARASFLRQHPDKGGILKTSQVAKVLLEQQQMDKACRSCAQPPRDWQKNDGGICLGQGGYMWVVVGSWYSAQISLKIKNLSDLVPGGVEGSKSLGTSGLALVPT